MIAKTHIQQANTILLASLSVKLIIIYRVGWRPRVDVDTDRRIVRSWRIAWQNNATPSASERASVYVRAFVASSLTGFGLKLYLEISSRASVSVCSWMNCQWADVLVLSELGWCAEKWNSVAAIHASTLSLMVYCSTWTLIQVRCRRPLCVDKIGESWCDHESRDSV